MTRQEKRRLDLLNWLKSELAEAEHPKMSKVKNHEKIELLKQIIEKL